MRRFGSDDGGQAIVIVASMMMVLILFVGLAIDAGQLFVARRTMQEAADAAAYAGAVVLYQHKTQGQPPAITDAETLAVAAAVADATRNGYTDNVGGATVTVNLPPSSGPFSGSYANRRLYVEVLIQTDVRTSLLPAVQRALTTVRVRGVAGAEPLNNQFAIMALDRGNVPNALNIQSGGTVDLSGGGILVNSTNTSAQAAWNQGGSIAYTCIAPAVCETHVAGNASGSFPSLTTGAPQEPDPLASFPKPSLPDCATPPATSCVYNAVPNDNIALPGVYTASLRANGNTRLVLQPGIYILKAGMDLGGTSSVASADATTTPACLSNCGVFLFNTTMNYPAAGGSCSSINLFGNASSSLKALAAKILPDPPPDPRNSYVNFLVYQDAACSATMAISGSSAFLGTGTIYLPTAHFRFDGQNATLTGSQLVANTVDIQTGNITIDFQAGNTTQPILPRLAE